MRWTSKSASKLAEGLRELGHQLVDRSVLRLLHRAGYTMQASVKTREGADHPDRDAQFQHINDTAAAAIKANKPVISVDTKHRELVGEFKNGGREWARSGEPVEVNTHDFPSHADGKAIPYGVYDLARNEGWVSVGILPRHRLLRGQLERLLVGTARQRSLPARHELDDHRGLRRLQQRPRPLVEARAAEARRSPPRSPAPVGGRRQDQEKAVRRRRENS